MGFEGHLIYTVIEPSPPPIFCFLQEQDTLRSGKCCLGLCNHIERKHIFVDIVGRIEPRPRQVLGSSITDTLRRRGVGVGKNLQRRAPIPSDLLKQLEPILDHPLVVDLVQ